MIVSMLVPKLKKEQQLFYQGEMEGLRSWCIEPVDNDCYKK
jgi:hypothetical protein